MASILAKNLQQLGVRLTREVQVNAIFALLNKKQIEALQKRYFFYVWNEETDEVRWMTSFDTSQADIDGFVSAVKEVINLK